MAALNVSACVTRLPPLSVVIPAYNEEQRLPSTLEAIALFLDTHGTQYEVLVVDDGSSDRTAQLMQRLSQNLAHLRLLGGAKNKGKGYAVRTGVLAARYPFILVTDADLSTPIEEVRRLLTAMDGADVVIATRARPDARVEVTQHPGRMLLGKIFNLLVRILGLTNFPDTQCGFKLWRAVAADNVFRPLRIERFAFDVEALYVARRLGWRIREVGVVWRNHPDSRVRICRDAMRMLADLFRIRFYALRGDYPQRTSGQLPEKL